MATSTNTISHAAIYYLVSSIVDSTLTRIDITNEEIEARFSLTPGHRGPMPHKEEEYFSVEDPTTSLLGRGNTQQLLEKNLLGIIFQAKGKDFDVVLMPGNKIDLEHKESGAWYLGTNLSPFLGEYRGIKAYTDLALEVFSKSITDYGISGSTTGLTTSTITGIIGYIQKWEEIAELFSATRPNEVKLFLEGHPFLYPLLFEAHTEIRKIFSNAQLTLEVVADPESIGNEELVLFISTALAPEDAVEKLEELDNKWWLDNLDRAQGMLCINLGFK